jgi:hypothetical protein
MKIIFYHIIFIYKNKKLQMKYLFNWNELFEGKLYLEDDFDKEDINWNYSIDISDIWNKYNEGILKLDKFNFELSNKLKNEDFLEIKEELKNINNQEDSIKIWNKIYDIADEKLIEIIT